MRERPFDENQIAVSSRAQDVIVVERWAALPEDQPEEWQPVDEAPLLYRRRALGR
jgi:hypothetical protein